MNHRWQFLLLLIPLTFLQACSSDKVPYGDEEQLYLPGNRQMVWAVAPTLDLSGQTQIDPLLQSDLVYQELQKVHGITVIPVNRVVEAYAAMRLAKVQSPRQADYVCQMLGADALLVPTITAYDPYDPPKVGVSFELFARANSAAMAAAINPHSLERVATDRQAHLPARMSTQFLQVVHVYDASDGTVRDRVAHYSAGRSDPAGPLGNREIPLCMDRYCAFCYHEMLTDLLNELAPPPASAEAGQSLAPDASAATSGNAKQSADSKG